MDQAKTGTYKSELGYVENIWHFLYMNIGLLSFAVLRDKPMAKRLGWTAFALLNFHFVMELFVQDVLWNARLDRNDKKGYYYRKRLVYEYDKIIDESKKDSHGGLAGSLLFGYAGVAAGGGEGKRVGIYRRQNVEFENLFGEEK